MHLCGSSFAPGFPKHNPRKKTGDIVYNNDISKIEAEEDFDWE